MLGITLGISAWGLVTGVAMVKSGLSVGMALFMSLVVFAGSSQLPRCRCWPAALRCGCCGPPPSA